MTGRLRFGKMSMGIRRTASPLPRATATTATMIVRGRRIAKLIGFMAQTIRWGDGRDRAAHRSGGEDGGSLVEVGPPPDIDARSYAGQNGAAILHPRFA